MSDEEATAPTAADTIIRTRLRDVLDITSPFDVLPPSNQATSLVGPKQVDDLAVRGEVLRAANNLDESNLEESATRISTSVEELIFRYGSWATHSLAQLHLEGSVTNRQFSEILRVLGDIKHEGSHVARFWLLVHCMLSEEDPWIRSSAAVGLAALGDPLAVPYLLRRAEGESIELLRERFVQTAEELARLTR